jgi:hypothetical protein
VTAITKEWLRGHNVHHLYDQRLRARLESIPRLGLTLHQVLVHPEVCDEDRIWIATRRDAIPVSTAWRWCDLVARRAIERSQDVDARRAVKQAKLCAVQDVLHCAALSAANTARSADAWHAERRQQIIDLLSIIEEETK